MALPDTLEQVQASAAVGAVVPLVAAICRQDRFSVRVNALILVAVTAVASVVTTAVVTELTVWSLLTGFVVMYTAAVAFHHGLWQPTGVAAAVQTRTSPKRRQFPALAPIAKSGAPRSDLSRC
jgi:hypothetical protein